MSGPGDTEGPGVDPQDNGAGPGDPDAELAGSSEEDLEALYDELDDGPPGDLDPKAEALAEELEEELVEEEQAREAVKVAGDATDRHPGPFRRLYRGETSFDFVGRRKVWFTISAVIILAGVAALIIRGGPESLLGIDFKGGTSWTVQANGATQQQVLTAVTNAGAPSPTVEVLGGKTVEVQADLNHLSDAQQQQVNRQVQSALRGLTHEQTISITNVGPTWGGEVTKRAILALVVFLLLVVLYISLRFEPKMALAAFLAMIHDLLVVIGIYSIAGFQITPDTVIAVLTILGYSLYDTVVVFDRVRENTKGLGAKGRMTYSEMINLSMNQTLARSINTSLVAILPVLAVLVVGAQILGAVTLQDYGLALFVGLLSGAYSSIFIASPLLAMLKEREPRYQQIRQRLEGQGDRAGLLTPAAAAALAGTGAAVAAGATGKRTGQLRPGASRPATRPAGSTGKRASAGPARSGGGGANRGGTATATKRPPPRPRKGGSKGKSKKRR